MKKAAFTVLQIAITLGLLWFVLRDPTKRQEMLEAIRMADWVWLALGFGFYGLVELIAGARWQLLLRVQGVVLSWSRVSMLVMIGVFFNFFVPGGTGGDVVKTFFLLKETPGKRPQALLSVLFDRLLGLFSMIVLAGVLIALRWDWLTTSPDTAKFVWAALAILGASLLVILLSFLVTGLGLIHKLPARLPGRDRLAELSLAYNHYGRAWRSTLGCFLLSLASHFAYFATFYCAAKSLAGAHFHVPSWADLCAIMPIVNTITALPISIGGVGFREHLFETFLGNLCGVSTAVAVVISSTGYLLTLAWGLIGGLLYIFYRPSEHARLREMTAEVSQLEHSLAEESLVLEIADHKIK